MGKQRSKKENLSKVAGAYLQVTHEHEIPGPVPLVMQGEMVDVAQHGFRANSVRRVLGVNVGAESLHEFDRILHGLFFAATFFFGCVG